MVKCNTIKRSHNIARATAMLHKGLSVICCGLPLFPSQKLTASYQTTRFEQLQVHSSRRSITGFQFLRFSGKKLRKPVRRMTTEKKQRRNDGGE
ncbi:hypothetical protein ACS0TY_014073 [Phlomoides rotata]